MGISGHIWPDLPLRDVGDGLSSEVWVRPLPHDLNPWVTLRNEEVRAELSPGQSPFPTSSSVTLSSSSPLISYPSPPFSISFSFSVLSFLAPPPPPPPPFSSFSFFIYLLAFVVVGNFKTSDAAISPDRISTWL